MDEIKSLSELFHIFENKSRKRIMYFRGQVRDWPLRPWLAREGVTEQERAKEPKCFERLAEILPKVNDWERATIREVQQVTAWSDTSISFTLDAQRLDPQNCWAIVLDDNEEVLEVLKLGEPTAVFQSIKRRTIGTGDANKVAANLRTSWTATGSDIEIEADVLILPGSCDECRD